MNRKLHHTLMALSATAAVFGVLLLAGGPLGSAPQPLMSVHASSIPLSGRATAAMDTVLQGDASERRHLRHSRALLALPYFSFAQGLRRNRS